MLSLDDETKQAVDALGELTEKNFPPEKKEEIRRLHLDTFRWQGERIPIGVLIADPENAVRQYPGIDDPLPFFKMKVKNITQSVSLASDLLPTVSLDYFGDSVLPSMLGCEIRFPAKNTPVADAALIGPWIMPLLTDIKQARDLEMPDMSAGYMPLALEAAAFFRERLPEAVNLSTIWKIEPFTLAALLRGPDIYTDLYDYPEDVHRLLDFCTELFIRTEAEFRKISGHGMAENISHWGIRSPGIRLNGDTIINLPPQILDEFVKKQWDRLAEAFGGPVYTHYCSTRAAKGLHLFPLLAGWDNTAGLSTQEGILYYGEHYGELRGRLAVESGYTGANAPDLFTPPGLFEKWTGQFRFRDCPNGLLLCYTSNSVEKGREIMNVYRRCFLN